MRWALTVVIALVAVGCGEEDEPTASATPTPTPTASATPEGRFETAWKVPRDVAKRLHKERNAHELIREEGELIASSDFDGGPSYPLAEWLDKQGIKVEDPSEFVKAFRAVYEQQDLYLMFMTTDAKVAESLDELEPSKRELATVYNRWAKEKVPDGGEAMADWLRIFKLAVREGDQQNVVIIPLL